MQLINQLWRVHPLSTSDNYNSVLLHICTYIKFILYVPIYRPTFHLDCYFMKILPGSKWHWKWCHMVGLLANSFWLLHGNGFDCCSMLQLWRWAWIMSPNEGSVWCIEIVGLKCNRFVFRMRLQNSIFSLSTRNLHLLM